VISYTKIPFGLAIFPFYTLHAIKRDFVGQYSISASGGQFQVSQKGQNSLFSFQKNMSDCPALAEGGGIFFSKITF